LCKFKKWSHGAQGFLLAGELNRKPSREVVRSQTEHRHKKGISLQVLLKVTAKQVKGAQAFRYELGALSAPVIIIIITIFRDYVILLSVPTPNIEYLKCFQHFKHVYMDTETLLDSH
jgi:hypothetical protein